MGSAEASEGDADDGDSLAPGAVEAVAEVDGPAVGVGESMGTHAGGSESTWLTSALRAEGSAAATAGQVVGTATARVSAQATPRPSARQRPLKPLPHYR